MGSHDITAGNLQLTFGLDSCQFINSNFENLLPSFLVVSVFVVRAAQHREIM